MHSKSIPVFVPLLLLGMIIPVTARKVSAKVVSFRKWMTTQNGPVRCALDQANETSSSLLEECSLNCARNDTCSGFNIKNAITCDHPMTPALASTSRTLSSVTCTTTVRRLPDLSQPARSTRLVKFQTCVTLT